MTTGLLLINLGTPDEPTTAAVRRYLREFLGDPRVLDMSGIGRAMLLNLVILPTRPAKSAEAYRTVWDSERGSPLLYHSQDLAAGVAAKLGAAFQVELAMRYGTPSLASAIEKLAACTRVIVLPLFPQYASSSTGTAVQRVMELCGAAWNVPPIDVVPAFHGDPGFIDAFVAVTTPVLATFAPDHVLFSYHGLPERQILKSDPRADGAKQCLTDGCCDRFATPTCYRAQCYATTRALLARLPIPSHTTCFQSRLGKTPWIQPFTDHVLDEVAKQGKKRLAVLCPAFVADCLETLEEIGMRAKAQFVAAGGEDLVLVPSLNATPVWIDAVAAMARRHAT